jgi:hypothetical protein
MRRNSCHDGAGLCSYGSPVAVHCSPREGESRLIRTLRQLHERTRPTDIRLADDDIAAAQRLTTPEPRLLPRYRGARGRGLPVLRPSRGAPLPGLKNE